MKKNFFSISNIKKNQQFSRTNLKESEKKIMSFNIILFVLTLLAAIGFYRIHNIRISNFLLIIGYLPAIQISILRCRKYYIPMYQKINEEYQHISRQLKGEKPLKKEISNQTSRIAKLTRDNDTLALAFKAKGIENKLLKRKLGKFYDMYMFLYIPDFGMNPRYEMDERTYNFVCKVYETFITVDPAALKVFDTYTYYSNDIYRHILDNHSEEYLAKFMYKKNLDKKANDSNLSGCRKKLIEIENDIIKRYKEIHSGNLINGKKGGSSGTKFTDYVGTHQYLDVKTLLEEVNETEGKSKEREPEKPEKSYVEEGR